MTVGELIEKLRALDPSLPVWLDCGDPYDAGEALDVEVSDVAVENPFTGRKESVVILST